jgi:hypothetical protein
MHDQTTPDIRRVPGDLRRRRAAGLVVVLVVAFIGVASTKPWGSPVASMSPTPGPLGSVGSSAPHSPAGTGTAVPATTTPTPAGPSPDAFTTFVPPPETATWSGIHWRRLAADDPLSLVRSVLRWRGGFLALGWLTSGGLTPTPVWTSTDGAHWEPLPFATGTTFWPGLLIVGVAEVRTGLVALTMGVGPNDCGGAFACQIYSAGVGSWTSPDGRKWTPRAGPDLGLPAQGRAAPVLAAGPAGLVAASPAPPTRVATSVDGVHWRTVPAGALPAGLAIGDIVGTTTGFTAVGALWVSESHYRAVALQSVDGATWTGPFPLHLVSASGVILASTGPSWGATALVSARNGLIAVGSVLATPGAELWWQSANGRDWRPLPTYPPLGPTTCTGEGCGSGPNGTLVGDGHRMVALRGGPDAGVWTSSDGLAWRRLPVAGDLPGEQATQAVLLPGGVLLSDGTTTWFGEANVR